MTSVVPAWRRLLPPYPFRAERMRGCAPERATAVACFAAAWQLLPVSLAVVLVVDAFPDPAVHTWLFFLPSIFLSSVASYAIYADHIRDNPLRLAGPWIVLKPAALGLLSAIGARR
ncbi:hypothetical protein [Nocardioides jiangxiensis]|uniref:Uncharacterized protein n=1 Tax=Nocardioides jiangxiensis TaxID=3064524 RepID=A0ABT9B4B1_9ACTN|nr:hypothetical protein [Nocardioides sp. WY-20]MDO7869558.1 hypothetical protein [Nocardioides sp. WY-20]